MSSYTLFAIVNKENETVSIKGQLCLHVNRQEAQGIVDSPPNRERGFRVTPCTVQILTSSTPEEPTPEESFSSNGMECDVECVCGNCL